MTPALASFYAEWRLRCGVVLVLREDQESPPERLLQTIWQHQRLLRDQLKTLDGQPVRAKKKLYVALHKPQGYLCTRRDLDERRTIGELLPAEWGNLYSVGRLDYQSEGLLFLTNDGSFCLKLTHPRYGVRKTYLATIEGRFEPSVLRGFREGVKVDGELLRAESTRVVSSGPSCSVVEVVLTEGKNREVRRLFEAANLTVSRLQRVRIGPVRLGELKPGRWRTLTESEIESLIAGL